MKFIKQTETLRLYFSKAVSPISYNKRARNALTFLIGREQDCAPTMTNERSKRVTCTLVITDWRHSLRIHGFDLSTSLLRDHVI